MIAYGCGKSGRIHRNVQTPHDPDNPKPRRGRPKREKGTPTPVIVTDMETGEAREYATMSDAAAAMGCRLEEVRNRVNGRYTAPVMGRYVVARKGL